VRSSNRVTKDIKSERRLRSNYALNTVA